MRFVESLQFAASDYVVPATHPAVAAVAEPVAIAPANATPAAGSLPITDEAAVITAIELVTERLLTRLDEAEAYIVTARSHADDIVREASANAARIIAEAQTRAVADEARTSPRRIEWSRAA
ncbi:MAG: hypothetical protein JWN41_1507 [Thermoleophilia bacterium]|nr:hypothetical protein [Thermoleophilia bacterium]